MSFFLVFLAKKMREYPSRERGFSLLFFSPLGLIPLYFVANTVLRTDKYLPQLLLIFYSFPWIFAVRRIESIGIRAVNAAVSFLRRERKEGN